MCIENKYIYSQQIQLLDSQLLTLANKMIVSNDHMDVLILALNADN